MKQICRIFFVVAFFITSAISAEANTVLRKAAIKGVTKRIVAGAAAKQAARQKLGPIRTFKKPTDLMRATNRPATEKARGIGGNGTHVFMARPRPGRVGSATHVQREFNIPHRVKTIERIRVPAGTKYHERPVLGGEQNRREVIVHGGKISKANNIEQRELARANGDQR